MLFSTTVTTAFFVTLAPSLSVTLNVTVYLPILSLLKPPSSISFTSLVKSPSSLSLADTTRLIKLNFSPFLIVLSLTSSVGASFIGDTFLS